jgi:hypothetical protein
MRWKPFSLFIRSLALANLALMVGVMSTHASRPTAIKVFWAFRISAVVLLLLEPVDYFLRRSSGAKQRGTILNVALTVLMLVVWLAVSAAAF